MTVDVVVKVGGALLLHPVHLDAALAGITAAARRRRILVVPGGGPFANAVRDADRRFHLSDDAAHWMAVLAMDQFAHLLADRLAAGVVVTQRGDIEPTLDTGHVPVFAPYLWMREVDPLPHTWEVTSDSIAACIAGHLGVTRLVLVKPPAATGDLVDAYFQRALPSGVTPMIVGADRLETLEAAL